MSSNYISGIKMRKADMEYRKFVEKQKKIYRKRYLSCSHELDRSGWNGTSETWRKAREVMLEAFDNEGRFLDVGCANGVLCRDLRKWAIECKGVEIIPYGFDFIPELIAESKIQNKGFEKNFRVSEIRSYNSSFRFKYIHLAFKCCRNEKDMALVLKKYLGLLERDGTMLACSYYDGWFTKSTTGSRVILDKAALLGKQMGYRVMRFVEIPGYESMVWLKKLSNSC